MTSNRFFKFFRTITLVLLLCNFYLQNAKGQYKPQRYNVLFIAVDDLKPDLRCFGKVEIYSPNIDRLSKSSTIFTSAYCQQAICGPTRASLLTGLRPDRIKIWDLKAQLRVENPNIITLPQYFKSNGYKTIGMGKVFDPSNVDLGGDTISWSLPFKEVFSLAKGYEDIAFGHYQSANIKAIVKAEGNLGKSEREFWGTGKNENIRYSTECLEVPDDAYMDGAMANYAVKELHNLKNSKQPFFFAIGFKKPHLPFTPPKKYWDLYKRDEISLPSWRQKAVNSPEIAYHNSGELRNYGMDIHPLEQNNKGNLLLLSEEKQRELIHGYYASISYVDAQIGKVLDALRENGMDKNTIVVLWGDHGWHLGDHSLWCKHSNFEQATRVPLILKVPKVTKGETYNMPVQLLDIFPTLNELNGIKPLNIHDGKSLLPALINNKIKINDYAISQYPRGANNNPKGIMGYTIRKGDYRYTEWISDEFTTAKAFDPSKLKASELYDYKNDPNETKNLVNDPLSKIVVQDLSNLLHQFYQHQYQTINQID